MNFFATDPSRATENVPCLHPSGAQNAIENAVFLKNKIIPFAVSEITNQLFKIS
jgi:hypothetical protein